MATPPQFAIYLSSWLTPSYLEPVKLTHDYHFPSNRLGMPGVFFEVRLKDAKGDVIETLRYPDANANSWVKDRQNQLAQYLGGDQPVAPPAGEAIPAPSQQVRMVQILEPTGARTSKITSVAEHLIPRDRPVMRPSEWSLAAARSYCRYLCRKHGAVSAELVRHWRDPLPPMVLFVDRSTIGSSDEQSTVFGEFPR